MEQNSAPPTLNRGAELLAGKMEGHSFRAFADDLPWPVSHSAIAAWVKGGSLPGYRHRKSLEEHLGIPMDAWEEAEPAAPAGGGGDHG